MKTMKKVLIDIDNTLWKFSEELFNQLKTKHPNFPPIEQWHEWDFWKNNCSEDGYWDAVNYIHLNQEKYKPFAEAKEFLKKLKDDGYHIIIMSYRIPESYNSTLNWFKNNDLLFDEIIFPENKKELFDSDCKFVIDDEPSVLRKAKELGIEAVGLKRFPVRDGQNDCRLFEDFKKLNGYVLERINV